MALRSTLRNWFGRRHLVFGTLGLLAVTLIAWFAFETTLNARIHDSREQAQRRLALFERTLEAIIERFHYLPVAISQARETRAALANPDDAAAVEAANGFLSKLNETAGAGEIFLMENNGAVVAASNWWTLTSLVGTNYSFRPYFAEALRLGRAEYYAFGISTNVPGYFLSQRVDGPDGPLGVAVTKINLGEIEAAWWRSGELIGIVDVNDVVILSTRPDWRYRPLQSISRARIESISSQQRYGENGVDNTGIITDRWFSRGAEFALLAGNDPETSGYFILQELRLPKHGWQLIAFTPLAPLYGGAWTAAAAAGLGAAALLLIVVLLVQRRRIIAQRLADHERLEQRVAERTEDLHIANAALREEIADRIRAENAQREAQAGLVQAAKMASLGQALAGVAHEVSQPVAALTTHIASARLVAAQKQDADIGSILSTMDRVVDRLAALTGHLKTFARKETRIEMQADLGAVLANALDLVDHKLRAFGIDVEYTRHRGQLLVTGNPVHLEQVFINLIANAADAMEHTAIRVLSIGIRAKGRNVEVAVSDTGSGIPEGELANLFDPFYSTKEAGRGLGLGLSISYGLVRDIGGAITVASVPGKGSTFTVRLPLTQTARTEGQQA
ncbi:MAG: two-component sensor histidine kinase [Alphaproteobacteria bacterium]|nr:two-component sensor histidine kinase [Alphaproteobacteria bacterium]MBU1561006.1 two-component sensor histidine kinase [Alphaproteobacteria bacterium]MBU2304980.1 two-component sensor histidine kinase [Alphaproteobacteria bacterium]MBU2370232.1 two-component sensor histidine kinase [Alphaproteobacteria bacterium]